jgi:EmrB/QacA subfamily drug resistance transporter
MNARATRRAIPKPGLLALLGLAEFMLVLDVSIVNVALPAIRGDLGFSQSALEWVVNGYALTFGGFLLLGGRAADVFGGRGVFFAALSAFSLASLACGLAGGQAALVVARVIQGLSAGVLSPATLSILTATYVEPAERNRALSIWTAVAIGGGAVGALLGGILTDVLSWRWIFFVNVPVGALLAALALSRLPHGAARLVHRRLDLAGAVTVTGGLVALIWALIRSSSAGWGSGQVIGGLAAALILLGAFAVIEARVAAAPLVPFSVFRSRLLSAGNALSFLSFVPVLPTWFFLTLYLQRVRGDTPIEAGLIFIPMSLAVIGGSQVGFRAIAQVSARQLVLAGGLVAAAGMAWLGQLTETTNLGWVIVPGCIAMLGGGLMFAPITIAATAGVEPEQGGLASGLLNTTRQIGGALGLAILGTIAATHMAGAHGSHAAALSAGYATAFMTCAAIFLATAVVGAVALPAQLEARGATQAPPSPSRAASRRPDANERRAFVVERMSLHPATVRTSPSAIDERPGRARRRG